MQLSFSLALIAGLVSFLSPCVLPLVPAYIGYMGGRVTNTVAAQTSSGALVGVSLNSRFSTMLHALAFVAGFTFVFVALGLLGTAFVSEIGRQSINTITNIIGRGGGLLIIFFGLHFMGILPSVFNILLGRQSLLASPLVSVFMAVVIVTLLYWIFADWLFAAPFIVLVLLALVLGGAFTRTGDFWTKAILLIQRLFYTDSRRQMVAQGHQSYAGSAIMGVVFSAGWTPCIGPVYGAILTMAAMGGSVSTAGTLLLAYSLGLGVPFLITALLLDRAQIILRHLTRHLHKIELVSGAFLVLIGVLVASGRLQYLSQDFATQFGTFSYDLEQCTVDLNSGKTDLGGFFNCARSAGSAPQAAVTDTTAVTTAATAEPLAQAAVPSILDVAAAPPVSGATTTQVGLEVGKIAPGFSTITDDGTPFTLADQRGKVVLLNFWATWCVPCRVEMPAFEQASKANPGLVIVGVNDNQTRDDIAGFRTELGLSFPLLLDPDARIQDLYAISAYPSTYVLNRDGVIIALHYGALSANEIAEMVKQALA